MIRHCLHFSIRSTARGQ